jgi:hypothetical protein
MEGLTMRKIVAFILFFFSLIPTFAADISITFVQSNTGFGLCFENNLSRDITIPSNETGSLFRFWGFTEDGVFIDKPSPKPTPPFCPSKSAIALPPQKKITLAFENVWRRKAPLANKIYLFVVFKKITNNKPKLDFYGPILVTSNDGKNILKYSEFSESIPQKALSLFQTEFKTLQALQLSEEK